MKRAVSHLAIATLALSLAAAGDTDAIRALVKEKRHPEAVEQSKAALATLEAAGRGETVEAAELLDLLVEASWRGGRVEPDTRAHAERAVRIKTAALGENDPAVAASLAQLGNLLNFTKDYAGARAAYERAVAIRDLSAVPPSDEVAATMYNLAQVLYQTKEFGGSAELHRRSLVMKEGLWGPDDPRLGKQLGQLATSLQADGRDDEAAPIYERAIPLLEKDATASPLSIAGYKGNLGVILMDRGDFRGARPLIEEMARLAESTPKVDPSLLGLALNRLGHFHLRAGDLDEAERLLARALEVRRKLGEDHPDVAETLHNLGVLAWRRRDLTRAASLHEQALAIRRGHAPDSLPVSESLNVLGLVHASDGRHDQARTLYEGSLAIAREIVGRDHPSVMLRESNLAESLFHLGRDAEALALFERVVAARERVLGRAHPAVGYTLGLQARALAVAGADDRAAAGAADRTLGGDGTTGGALRGPGAPAVARSRDRALAAALRASEIDRRQVELNAVAWPERQALAFTRNVGIGLDVGLSLAARGLSVEERRGVWEALARRRGLVTDAIAERRRATFDAADPKTAEIAGRLRERQEELARLLLSAPGSHAAERMRTAEQSRREMEETEQRLAERSLAFRRRRAEREISWAQIATSLPRDAALVAYAVYYDRLDMPKAADGRSREPALVPSYLAFVLSPGGDRPEVFRLGPAEAIEERIRAWRTQVASPPVGGAGELRRDETTYRRAAEALRESVWDPLAAGLEKAKRVFVIPDGALHVVNPATFPFDAERYWAEAGPQIHFLTAERDLVRLSADAPVGKGLIAFGAPDFEAAAAPADAVAIADGRERTRAEDPCGRSPARFDPLPGSRLEIERIAGHWSAPERLVRTGAEATESAFKTLARGRRVVHAATHAFFSTGECTLGPEEEFAAEVLARWSGAEGGKPPSRGAGLATISGLAFAGANRRSERAPEDEGDDGMLTALEISSLDLRGVEWVVLSACETGLGELTSGEGVLGLRRSFLLAGARTAILSLWRVQDEPAMEWMDRLYEARFVGGRSTTEAVRKASTEMIAARRRAGRTTHPFYWGAFVAAGDWR